MIILSEEARIFHRNLFNAQRKLVSDFTAKLKIDKIKEDMEKELVCIKLGHPTLGGTFNVYITKGEVSQLERVHIKR